MKNKLIEQFIQIINNRSIGMRVSISLFANVFRSVLNFITVLVLARSLAPTGYGDFMFLIGSFVAIRSLMDLGAANAFFTFISQNKNRSAHYLIYFSWLAIQFAMVCLFIIIICPETLLYTIWVGHSRYIILLAFIASFLQQQAWQTVNQIGESERKTVLNQIIGVSIALVNLLGIVVLRISESLNIISVLIFYIVENAIFISVAMSAMGVKQYLVYPSKVGILRKLVIEYRKYCYPLIATTVVGFLYSYGDTWMLQFFGGSRQQGLFQIANQFATISLLATSSILNIFWKEIAIAYEQNSKEKVQQIYFKAMRGLVMFGAVVSGFLIPWTNQIILFFLGESYTNAGPILVIMFLYPIHQSMGQLTGAFFLSTKQTKVYSVVTILMMVVSMPVTYIIQAPTTGYLIPGLGLGALGLSLKIVLLNIVSVNICAYIISRMQKWHYDYSHQFFAVIVTSGMGYISYLGAQLLGDVFFVSSLKFTLLFQGIIAAIIYFPSILCLVYYVPGMVGLSHLETKSIVQRLKVIIK